MGACMNRICGLGWIRRIALGSGLALIMIFSSCTPDEPEATVPLVKEQVASVPPTPLFDPDSAFAFVKKQVDFGPRVPGTAPHTACGDWMVSKLKSYGALVTEQTGMVTIYSGAKIPLRNIIGTWRPEKKDRILLLAHWDTRPFADRDTERKNEPIDGANDAGSGVGVLLEIARHLAVSNDLLGVDILFTDAEDHGQPNGAMAMDESSMDTWCLGSQYFVKNPHVSGYNARFGILLDMVGGRDAVFYQEALSMQYSGQVVHKVWKTAAALGYGDRFIRETKYFVGIDDHIPINKVLRIPTIDIIQHDPETQAFAPHWHTHGDNMDVIDPTTLKAVGQTVMEVLWKER